LEGENTVDITEQQNNVEELTMEFTKDLGSIIVNNTDAADAADGADAMPANEDDMEFTRNYSEILTAPAAVPAAAAPIEEEEEEESMEMTMNHGAILAVKTYAQAVETVVEVYTHHLFLSLSLPSTPSSTHTYTHTHTHTHTHTRAGGASGRGSAHGGDHHGDDNEPWRHSRCRQAPAAGGGGGRGSTARGNDYGDSHCLLYDYGNSHGLLYDYDNDAHCMTHTMVINDAHNYVHKHITYMCTCRK
jgi:hypothetical protein